MCSPLLFQIAASLVKKTGVQFSKVNPQPAHTD
jgi:hypothetical protein